MLKLNWKFSKDEVAVSPVIGVILMVAITVILAAVIAAFVFNMGGNLTEAPPSINLVAMSNSASGGPDIVIKHEGGDPLSGGDWKFSVVGEGNNSAFVTSHSSDDFEVGMQLIVENHETDEDSSSGLTTWKWDNSGGKDLKIGEKYTVQIVHIPSNSMVLDSVVEIR